LRLRAAAIPRSLVQKRRRIEMRAGTGRQNHVASAMTVIAIVEAVP
jgi:hypothetical protein